MTALVAVTTALAGEDALRDWQEGRSTLAEKKLAAAMAAWDGPEAFAELARAWATMGRERMLLKLVDEGLLRTAHLLDDDPVRRAIVRAAAENLAARPERELELWRKLVASYWRPGDPEARGPREALATVLQAQNMPDEAIALLRSIYADHHDGEAAAQLVPALLVSDLDEAESIAREWFARAEPGPERARWASLLATVIGQQGKRDEADALRLQHPTGGVCGGFHVGMISASQPGDPSPDAIRAMLAGAERSVFDGLYRAAGPMLTEAAARELAGDIIEAFSRAYLSVHPSWAISVAVLLADRLNILGLAGPAAEIARRTEALLIEHQGEDSPLLEDARGRLTPFRPNAAAAPNPAP